MAFWKTKAATSWSLRLFRAASSSRPQPSASSRPPSSPSRRQDDPPEQGQELGLGTKPLQESQELRLQLMPRDVHLPTARPRRAGGVGVPLPPPLCPGGGAGGGTT